MKADLKTYHNNTKNLVQSHMNLEVIIIRADDKIFIFKQHY